MMYEEDIQKLVTGKCLIATDVDKTIVEQRGEDPEEKQKEEENFFLDIAPQLTKAVKLGTQLAVITGNSMHQLASRFLKWMVEQLCFSRSIKYLNRIHFFCNSGGVYAHFTITDKLIQEVTEPGQKPDSGLLFKKLTRNKNGKLEIHPKFIRESYLRRTKINDPDKDVILKLLSEVWTDYRDYVKKEFTTLETEYYLNKKIKIPEGMTGESYKPITVTNEVDPEEPGVESREIYFLCEGVEKPVTVQITLKPVISWRHAKNASDKIRDDVRQLFIRKIQDELDRIGLSQYIARPGGRSSIDITLEKLDKAYAVEYLIDQLNIAGQRRFNEKLGSNVIYIGDEVLSGGGNDYPVTRIPGVLVLAVNPEPEFVPFLSNVFMPSAILSGPEAAESILSLYNSIAKEEIRKHSGKRCDEVAPGEIRKAVELLKEQWFADRISKKVASENFKLNLSVHDKQIMHTLVSLICRNDKSAKEWISILVQELDHIMNLLDTNKNKNITITGLGASHPDG